MSLNKVAADIEQRPSAQAMKCEEFSSVSELVCTICIRTQESSQRCSIFNWMASRTRTGKGLQSPPPHTRSRALRATRRLHFVAQCTWSRQVHSNEHLMRRFGCSSRPTRWTRRLTRWSRRDSCRKTSSTTRPRSTRCARCSGRPSRSGSNSEPFLPSPFSTRAQTGVSVRRLTAAAFAKYDDIKARSATGLSYALEKQARLRIDVEIQPTCVQIHEGGVLDTYCQCRVSQLRTIELGVL